MANEGKLSKFPPKNLTESVQNTSTKSETNKPSTPKPILGNSINESFPQSRSISDDYKLRALSFLKNITTGSPVILPRSDPSPEPLMLIPCESTLHLGVAKNQEENIQLGKVQTWITSGVIKKSYKHCLESKFVLPTHRPVINLNEYPGRIIPSPIKAKLNEEFFKAFPHIDSKLTLSKLVNLREDLILNVWKQVDSDPVTLAVGLTCFDRLLNMNLVNKTNRKLFAAVCLLLAFKFMEESKNTEMRDKKENLIHELYRMDKHDTLTKKKILEAEFCVYSYLNFTLHLKYNDIKETLNYIQSRL